MKEIIFLFLLEETNKSTRRERGKLMDRTLAVLVVPMPMGSVLKEGNECGRVPTTFPCPRDSEKTKEKIKRFCLENELRKSERISRHFDFFRSCFSIFFS